MINLLKQKDYFLMEYYINCYATYPERGYSSELAMSNFMKNLETWGNNKSSLIKNIFGDKLILEKEVCLYENKEDFISRLRQSYAWSIIHSISCDIGDCCFSSLITENNIYENKIIDGHIPDSPKYNCFKKGGRLLKALRKFIKTNAEDSLCNFDEFSRLISMRLQDSKISGTLCLSIHPLDYITMSDNDCNWSSCMSWNEGSYSMGTLSTMNSSDTIVAYLKSDRDMVRGDFVWNNKKWRQLYSITDEFILPNRHYPYKNNIIQDTIVEWIKELAIGRNYIKTEDIIRKQFKLMCGSMCNDIGPSDCVVLYKSEDTCSELDLKVELGGDCYCLGCGELSFDIGGLHCENCMSDFYSH